MDKRKRKTKSLMVTHNKERILIITRASDMEIQGPQRILSSATTKERQPSAQRPELACHMGREPA